MKKEKNVDIVFVINNIIIKVNHSIVLVVISNKTKQITIGMDEEYLTMNPYSTKCRLMLYINIK